MFRRTSLLAAGLAVVLAMLLAPAAPLRAAEPEPSERSLDSVRERIGALKRRIENSVAERDSAAREVETIEQRIAEAQRGLRELRGRLRAQADKVAQTEAERAETERQLAAHRQALAGQLRAAYVMGRGSQTQMLLNLDRAQTVGRMLSYHDYLQRAQFAAIERIRAKADELAALSVRLDEEKAELERLRAEQETVLAELRGGHSARADALAAMKAELASEQAQLKQLQAEEKAIRQLIESLRKQREQREKNQRRDGLPPDVAPSQNAFTAQKGKLPWPVRGGLIARYGEAKSDSRLSWNGHWIAAPEGAAIRAVARGRVAYVGWMHRYGLIALVEHDGGYYTLYGHCQSVDVTVGAEVSAGQTLGAAGTTGGYEQSGVYFEIRKGTTAVNPAQWLAR